jgi:hypothetical protein
MITYYKKMNKGDDVWNDDDDKRSNDDRDIMRKNGSDVIQGCTDNPVYA